MVKEKKENSGQKKDYVATINQIVSRLTEGTERMTSILDAVTKIAEQGEPVTGKVKRQRDIKRHLKQRRFNREVGRLQRMAKDTSRSTQQMSLLINTLNEMILNPQKEADEDVQFETDEADLESSDDEEVESVQAETTEEIPVVEGEVIPPQND